MDGSQRWLLIHDWPLPDGYNHSTVTAAIAVPSAYPDAALDMVYFQPHVARRDGKTIPAVSNHRVLGTDWQRWSRHYTGKNPWRVGEDDMSTHMILIDHWLRREFQ